MMQRWPGLGTSLVAGFLTGFSLLTTPLGAGAQDDPDVGKEKRLHQIYRNYYATPTSNEKWSEAISRTKEQTYRVQKGDTLWAISETFFGDPNFWPKIWSLNTDIYNPHEILPSATVTFSPGSTSEPPALAVGPTDSAAPPAPEATPAPPPPPTAQELRMARMQKHEVGQYVDLDLTQINIPPPSHKGGPPRAFPRSVPPYRLFRDPEKEAQVEVTRIKQADTNVPMLVSHFVADSDVQSVGEVLGTEFGFRTASEQQEILIKSEGLTTGSRVLAIRRMGSLPNLPGILAFAINGQLEVREAVDQAAGVYRALVIKSLSLVAAGDILVQEEIPSTVPGAGGTMSPVSGRIVGGQFSTARRLFGPYSIVYLNAGSAQGLSVGAHVPVYRNPYLRMQNTLIRENPAEIGELQVVRVGNGVATAVVVRQIEDIRVGDVTSPVVEIGLE